MDPLVTCDPLSCSPNTLMNGCGQAKPSAPFAHEHGTLSGLIRILLLFTGEYSLHAQWHCAHIGLDAFALLRCIVVQGELQ